MSYYNALLEVYIGQDSGDLRNRGVLTQGDLADKSGRSPERHSQARRTR